MKTITLALCLAASAYGVTLASDSQHAVIVDMPEVATLSHASPDTWHTLPPVQPYDESTSTAASDFGAPLVFGHIGPLLVKRQKFVDALPGSVYGILLTWPQGAQSGPR